MNLVRVVAARFIVLRVQVEVVAGIGVKIYVEFFSLFPHCGDVNSVALKVIDGGPDVP